MDAQIQDKLNIGIMVTDHVSAMLAYWDKNLVCRFANAAYKYWFGKGSEEIVDKITIKELLGPELYKKNLPYILGALEGKAQTFEREIHTPKGEIRYAIANDFPDIENGKVKGFYAHVADVTPMKLLEIEALKSAAIINEQNNRLLNFANIVSHNLKSHASNLAAVLELFIHADSDEMKEKMLHYLQNISKGFSATVNSLNEVVKSQNLSELKPQLINLHDYIEKSIQVLIGEIKAAHATIRNNVTKDIILLSNPIYMESIIMNVLSNAIKYRHPAREPVIGVNSFIENKTVELRISDNGLGINLEKHGKDLFGMYKTFHGNPGAEGVGLFITKFQVESMGGRVAVESVENKSTTFHIYFNLQPENRKNPKNNFARLVYSPADAGIEVNGNKWKTGL
jgi:PAS domain S-box-containing protein